MERLARVASLWNWLPGFRAVAETENLHEAARNLDLSPSALSRTIRLLEDELGQALFSRAGRSLSLTGLGQELLAVVRVAMRAVDDVTAPRADVVRIVAPADVATMMVLPALVRLRAEGRACDARVASDVHVDPAGRVLRGEVDVVLTCAELIEPRLLCEQVSELRVGLYVGPSHPLRDGAPSLDMVLASDFVAYRAPGGPAERWPERAPRHVALWLGDARDAIAACLAGRLVAALPDSLVARCGEGLHRLGVELIEPVPLFAVRRRTLGPAHVADLLVETLRRTGV